MSTRHEVSSAMDFLTTDVILLFSHFAAGFTFLSLLLLTLFSFTCVQTIYLLSIQTRRTIPLMTNGT